MTARRGTVTAAADLDALESRADELARHHQAVRIRHHGRARTVPELASTALSTNVSLAARDAARRPRLDTHRRRTAGREPRAHLGSLGLGSVNST